MNKIKEHLWEMPTLKKKKLNMKFNGEGFKLVKVGSKVFLRSRYQLLYRIENWDLKKVFDIPLICIISCVIQNEIKFFIRKSRFEHWWQLKARFYSSILLVDMRRDYILYGSLRSGLLYLSFVIWVAGMLLHKLVTRSPIHKAT